MKKLLCLFILIGLSLSIGLVVYGAPETIDYQFNFYQDRRWDILDGSFDADTNYWATNRLRIYDNEITLNNLNWHHLLLWDHTGSYLGYLNPTSGGYEDSTYLGDTDVTVDLPPTATWFSLTAYELHPIDKPITDLNGNTLREVFEDTSLLESSKLIEDDLTNYNFVLLNGVKYIDIVAGEMVKRVQEYTLVSGDLSALTTTLTNVDRLTLPKSLLVGMVATDGGVNLTQYVENFNQQVIAIEATYNNVIYTNYHAMGSTALFLIITKGTYANLAAAQTALAGTKILYQLATPIEIFDIPLMKMNQQYSPLFEDTFDNLSDANIKTQMDVFVTYPYLFIDYDDLGIEGISHDEMQNYWSDYYTWTVANPYADGLTALLFYSVEATYEREEIVQERMSFLELVEDRLDSLDLGLFPHIGIAVAIMIGLGIVLLLIHLPSLAIFSIEIMLFILFSLIGWFPIYLVLIVSIGLLIGIIMMIRGGKGE